MVIFGSIQYKMITNLIQLQKHSGLQKDRDRGTAGPKEGLIQLGRFEMKTTIDFQCIYSLQKSDLPGVSIYQMNLLCY